jgi:hypothetical protein
MRINGRPQRHRQAAEAVGLCAYASADACVAEAEEEVRQLWSVLRAVSVPHEPTGG